MLVAQAFLGMRSEVSMANHPRDPEEDLGFDPDSPDLEDPQVDPVGPAKAPDDGPDVDTHKRVDDDQYPPYKAEK
jgi:hypothetical protein